MSYTSRLSVRAFIILLFFTISMILSGCSQSTKTNTCSAPQKNSLIKEYNKLNYQIIQKRSELISAHENILTNNCSRYYFSPNFASAICNAQRAKAVTIQSEINNLRHQAAIYQNVINGAVISHPSLQSDGCTMRGTQRKVKAKNTKSASKGKKNLQIQQPIKQQSLKYIRWNRLNIPFTPRLHPSRSRMRSRR